MNKAIDKEINAALFRLRWTFMSNRKRYAYLWHQTMEGQLRKGKQLSVKG